MEWGDRYLVWRLRRGDADACRELIRRHHHVVFGHLRRLGADRALAEDLTQETYAKAWCKIEGLRQATSLRSWLLTIARNEYLQFVRSRNPEVNGLSELPEPAAEEPGADALAAVAERDSRVQDAVRRLEPQLRETVALHYFQDLSIKEVAEVLGVPNGTVKSRLNRALETLRSLLEQEETRNGPKDIGEVVAGHS